MSSSYGRMLRLTVFGQSHSSAIGMTLEGLPAGQQIDPEQLQQFINRRAPGQADYATPRKEADQPEFLSGLNNGITNGAPICAIIRNSDSRPDDYAAFADTPRPGHADFTAEVKYRGVQDKAGGGHFSGRLTAPLCIAGGICLQLLEQQGIRVISHISRLGGISDSGELTDATAEQIDRMQQGFPVLDQQNGLQMQQAIAAARAEGDSLGGVIECAVLGLPAGLGDPMFDGMENRIAGLVFGIPAVKGIEFGAGFQAAELRGSENNDPFAVKDGRIVTETNNCGGILGGITTGMPLIFRTAVKPTPSIAKKQQTVNLKTLETADLQISGRHDPCIVPRAVPCMEAAAAIAVYDALLESMRNER